MKRFIAKIKAASNVPAGQGSPVLPNGAQNPAPDAAGEKAPLWKRTKGRVFGSTWAELLEREHDLPPAVRRNPYRYVPLNMQRFVQALETEDALTTQGIYRAAGSRRLIDMYRQRFNQTGLVDFAGFDEIDYHSIADSFKQFLREVPGGVLATWQQEQLADDDADVAFFQSVLLQTPQPQLDCLIYLARHLRRIASYSDVNKMTLNNLARVFGPNLFEWKDAEWADHATGYAMTMTASALFVKIVEHYNEIFGAVDLTPMPQDALQPRVDSANAAARSWAAGQTAGAMQPSRSTSSERLAGGALATPDGASSFVTPASSQPANPTSHLAPLNRLDPGPRPPRNDWDTDESAAHSRAATGATANVSTPEPSPHTHVQTLASAEPSPPGTMSRLYRDVDREAQRTAGLCEDDADRDSDPEIPVVPPARAPPPRPLTNPPARSSSESARAGAVKRAPAPAAVPQPAEQPKPARSSSSLQVPDLERQQSAEASESLPFPTITVPSFPASELSSAEYRQLKDDFMQFHQQLKELKTTIRALDVQRADAGGADRAAARQLVDERRRLHQQFRSLRVVYDQLKTYLESRRSDRSRATTAHSAISAVTAAGDAAPASSSGRIGQYPAAPLSAHGHSRAAAAGGSAANRAGAPSKTPVDELVAEKRRLQKKIQTYCSSFRREHGRDIKSVEERAPIAHDYARYKELKAILARLATDGA